jgi:hypothetical protein
MDGFDLSTLRLVFTDMIVRLLSRPHRGVGGEQKVVYSAAAKRDATLHGSRRRAQGPRWIDAMERGARARTLDGACSQQAQYSARERVLNTK